MTQYCLELGDDNLGACLLSLFVKRMASVGAGRRICGEASEPKCGSLTKHAVWEVKQ